MVGGIEEEFQMGEGLSQALMGRDQADAAIEIGDDDASVDDLRIVNVEEASAFAEQNESRRGFDHVVALIHEEPGKFVVVVPFVVGVFFSPFGSGDFLPHVEEGNPETEQNGGAGGQDEFFFLLLAEIFPSGRKNVELGSVIVPFDVIDALPGIEEHRVLEKGKRRRNEGEFEFGNRIEIP